MNDLSAPTKKEMLTSSIDVVALLGVQSGLTFAEILKAGGWSNAQTFTRLYHKPIEGNFGASILTHFRNIFS